eukprot:2524952-Pleurochrysis_carterae.AAC.3
MRLWTGELMNGARIQMKMWIEKRNEHKNERKGEEDEKGKKEKTYGIKHWSRVRSIPRIHAQVKNFLQKGIG